MQRPIDTLALYIGSSGYPFPGRDSTDRTPGNADSLVRTNRACAKQDLPLDIQRRGP